jgi:hypothetical protein
VVGDPERRDDVNAPGRAEIRIEPLSRAQV